MTSRCWSRGCAGYPAENVVSWTLPAELTSASRARTLIRRPLRHWGLTDLVPTAELLVSELVTNAVRYAQGKIGLRLVLEGGLVIEVLDDSAALPRLRHPDESDERGRGLQVVSQLAQRWGAGGRSPARSSGASFRCRIPDRRSCRAADARASAPAGSGRGLSPGVLLDGELAVLHDADPLCPARHRAVVRDQHHRQAAVPPQLLQQADDVVPGALVQVAGRLVGQQDLGLLDQRPGDGDALLLSAGQLGRQMPDPVGQANVGQCLPRPGAAAQRWRHAAAPAQPPRSPERSASESG